ncbi:MAG: N-acetyltransferase GCN5 [Anaerolineaceae bacterium]|nr:MAG: N-acetyltransferase GCN5 [Anaerolineaceae bacterium]
MPDIRLREFRFPEDYPAVRLLWENAGPGVQLRRSDTPEEIGKKLQRDPDLFLVAELDGRIVGTVIGGFDGRRGLIYHLAVEPGLRERGVGSLLMDEVERRLQAKGCIRSYLLVTAENEQSMRFYEKRGWSHMDTVLVYGKDL